MKVVEAKLTKNFDAEEGGNMDPFARIDWLAEHGERWEFCVTKPHIGGHMAPIWNKLCLPVDITTACTKASLAIDVCEMDGDDDVDHCGTVNVPLAALLELARNRSDESSDLEASEPAPFQLLQPNGDPVGDIYLQVMVAPPQKEGQTLVDDALFHSPVKRIGVSGGTAPFFTLALKDATPPDEAKYWIGKDLSHALDEVGFYESLLHMRRTHAGIFGPIIGFTFDYKGVVSLRVADSPDVAPPRQLLVLRNLFHRMKRLRLLDIKMGEATGAAGWQGKSRMSAIRQALIDGITNSSTEGFRLEGFEGEPASLLSQDPLLDLKQASAPPPLPRALTSKEVVKVDSKEKTNGNKQTKTAKKARRLMLQRMRAQDMLYYFSDTHDVYGWPLDPRGTAGEDFLRKYLSPAEAMEKIMAELLDQLVRLAIACRLLKVPQKWIGSSVALGFDAGRLYDRGITEADLQKYLHCNIFDWGRSELLTSDRFGKLSEEQQADREKYWGYYCSGIDRLSFEMLKAYCLRYEDRDTVWKEVVVTIMDFDSLSPHDFLGRVVLPLEETDEKSVPLLNSRGSKIPNASLTYWIGRRAYPVGSKFQEAWFVHIARATRLPASPRNPDPFAKVYFVPEHGERTRVEERTKTLPDAPNPMWNETFELPVLRRDSCSDNKFLLSLSTADTQVEMNDIRAIAGHQSPRRTSLEAWKRRLDVAAEGQRDS